MLHVHCETLSLVFKVEVYEGLLSLVGNATSYVYGSSDRPTRSTSAFSKATSVCRSDRLSI